MSGNCSVDKCNKNSKCQGLCSKHYYQLHYLGKILERTIYDPNEFIIDNKICWIVLYNKDCIECARTKILTIYYEQIRDSKLKWHLNSNNYVTASWIDENDQRYDE